jgi:HDOD domain
MPYGLRWHRSPPVRGKLPLAHAQKQEAYIAGLVHDIGKLILAVHLPDEYRRVIAVARVTERPLRELELDQIGIDHAELSGIAGHQWKLPESSLHRRTIPPYPVAGPLLRCAAQSAHLPGGRFSQHLATPLKEAGERPSEILNWPCYQVEAATALKAFWRVWPMMRSLLKLQTQVGRCFEQAIYGPYDSLELHLRERAFDVCCRLGSEQFSHFPSVDYSSS